MLFLLELDDKAVDLQFIKFHKVKKSFQNNLNNKNEDNTK